MKKLLLLVLAGLFACSTSTSNPPSCEGDDCNQTEPGDGGEGDNKGDGKLSVEGRYLMKNGQPFVLRGMSLYWYKGPWGGTQNGYRFYTRETVMELRDTWGANLVRAAIGNVHEDAADALGIAKNMMDWTKEAGIYVIIDNHSYRAHRPGRAESTNNFFRDVSAYVQEKSYTHVIYEVYNEPRCDLDNMNYVDGCPMTTWNQIKAFAEGIISTIRSNDPDGVILVGTPNWSSGLDHVLHPTFAGPIDGKNIMYSFHYYASASAHDAYKTYFKRFYCANLPAFVSEWGTTLANGTMTDNGVTYPLNWDNNNEWMSIIEGAKVSWANWSIWRSTDDSAVLSNNPAIAATAPEYTNLNHQQSPSGQRVQTWIRELNAGRSVEGVNPEQISCN
ncbi:MAG: glycoside hydrolase family 5 protein [Fibromonadales bacterium]|nr:glycoside hydrolase family 5 protein [Fibromonadales bacterium]